MRKSFLILPVLALAACEPTVPNSAAGVGFGDYQGYLAQREAQLQGQARPAPVLASGTGYAGSIATAQSGAPLSAGATGAAAPLNATGLSTAPLGPGAAVPSAVPAATGAAPGSIGAEALAALRATAPAGAAAPVGTAPAVPSQAPAALPAPVSPVPTAPVVRGAAGPNLAAYALAASNAPGQSVWPRGGLKLANAEKACAKYVSPDLAQMAFLERGGPQKDPANLDPDGDGFACGWDPRPFQAARQ